MRTLPLPAALCAAALAMASLPAAASPDWDLLGVKIGMTEAQVRAVFQAVEPKGRIVALTATLGYSDKINSFRTEPFLDRLELRVVRQAQLTPLRVWFSGPVGEVRVIGIGRQEMNTPNPPTAAQFQQSLHAKYGPPTVHARTMPVWEEAGKPSCARTSYGVSVGDFPQVVTLQKPMAQVVIEMQQRREADPRSPMPADLSRCGRFMFYTTGMDPVSTFYAGLFDVGALVATIDSRRAWVEQLQAEAIKKREGQGQAPRL